MNFMAASGFLQVEVTARTCGQLQDQPSFLAPSMMGRVPVV